MNSVELGCTRMDPNEPEWTWMSVPMSDLFYKLVSWCQVCWLEDTFTKGSVWLKNMEMIRWKFCEIINLFFWNSAFRSIGFRIGFRTDFRNTWCFSVWMLSQIALRPKRVFAFFAWKHLYLKRFCTYMILSMPSDVCGFKCTVSTIGVYVASSARWNMTVFDFKLAPPA